MSSSLDGKKFQRVFQLTIGSGADEIVISDLGDNPYARRVSFNVTSSLGSYTQGATFQIYNLTIEEIKIATTIKQPITFQAGYYYIHGDNPPVIYTGNVTNFSSVRVGTDIVTTLTCQAFKESLKTPILVSYEQDTAVTTVLNEVQGTLFDENEDSIPIKIIGSSDFGNITDDINSGGMSTQDFMDYLGKNFNFNWWCDMITKQFVIVPVGRVLKENQITIVNSDTGLIGSPEISATGLSFETMLEPDLRHTSLVKIEYSNSTTSFLIGSDVTINKNVKSATVKVTRLTHSGDTRADEWKTSVGSIWWDTSVETYDMLG